MVGDIKPHAPLVGEFHSIVEQFLHNRVQDALIGVNQRILGHKRLKNYSPLSAHLIL